MELFDLWCQGDKRAGNSLFQRHFDSLYQFFANKVENDIDELIQNTLLACVRSRDRFRKKSSFRTYLFSIARNELYGYMRRRKRASSRLDFGVTSIAAMGISPTSRLALNERHQLLLRALRSLSIDQQILLELHYWEEMRISELADLFDIAEDATRARLSRARKTLRKRLEEESDALAPQYEKLDDLDVWARSIRRKSAMACHEAD